MLQCVAVCCSVWQCFAVCCGVLQCVVVCCSVLQCVRSERAAKRERRLGRHSQKSFHSHFTILLLEMTIKLSGEKS